MKHECKDIIKTLVSIKKFNKDCNGLLDVLDIKLYDVPRNILQENLDGVLFDILVYGKKAKKKEKGYIARGFGMRWLYCPFCGEKLGEK